MSHLRVLMFILLAITPAVRGQEPANESRTGTMVDPDPGLGVSGITTHVSAEDLAAAMGIPATQILSADLWQSDGRAVGVASGPLGSWFPTSGDTFAILSTGHAANASRGNLEGNLSLVLGGPDNIQGNDLVRLDLTLQAPLGVNCAGFDFAFYSEEFPEWVGSQYNDAFTAEKGGTNITISGSSVTAPLNFAFDQGGRLITVNTVFGYSLGTATTYDGTTPLLRATTPVAPDEPVRIVFTIQDLGDSIYDSAVFLDRFYWGSGTNCTPGSFTTLESVDVSLRAEDAMGAAESAAPTVLKAPGDLIDFYLPLVNKSVTEPQEGIGYIYSWSPSGALANCVEYATDDADDYDPAPGRVTSLDPAPGPGSRRAQVFRCRVSPSAVPAGQSVQNVEFRARAVRENEQSPERKVTIRVVRTAAGIIATNRHGMFREFRDRGEAISAIQSLLTATFEVAESRKLVVLYADREEGDSGARLRSWDADNPELYGAEPCTGSPNEAALGLQSSIQAQVSRLTTTTTIFGIPVGKSRPSAVTLLGDDRIAPMYRHCDPTNGDEWDEDGGGPYPGSLGRALQANFLPVDDFFGALGSDDWHQGEHSLDVGRVLGERTHDVASLLRRVGPSAPAGRVVNASSDGFDLADAPSEARDAGFEVANDATTAGVDTVDNDDWRKVDHLLSEDNLGANVGADMFLMMGHANQDVITVDLRAENSNKDSPPGSNYSEFRVSDINSTSSGYNRVGVDEPLVILNGCHSGLPIPLHQNLVYGFLRSGARGYVGSTGYVWFHPSYQAVWYGEALQRLLVEELFHESSVGHSETIGTALRRAKRRYYTVFKKLDPRVEKTTVEMALFGTPWAVLRYPVASAASNGSGESSSQPGVTVIGVTALDGGRYRLEVEVQFDAPTIREQGIYHLIEIPGATNVPFNREPILPVSAALRISKPPGFALHGITWSRSPEEDLGPLTVPGIEVASGTDPIFGPSIGYVPSEGSGVFPATEVEVLDRPGDVTVLISPVRHEPSTRDTSWSSTWRLAIEYESGSAISMDEPESAKEVVGGSGASIPFVLPVRNLSDVPKDLAARVVIGGIAHESGPTHVDAGATARLQVQWAGTLPPGAHEAELTVLDGVHEAAVATRHVNVRQGAIRSFDGPVTIRPSSVATFNVSVGNEDTSSHVVSFRMAIVDASGVEVSGVPETAEVGPGDESTTSLLWNSGDTALGHYIAQVRVYTEDGLWGIRSRAFDISMNQRPVAVCPPPQSVECAADEGHAVLDGSGSYDADGDPITYEWSTESCALDSPDSASPTATCDLGQHGASLVVFDGTETSEVCTTTVDVLDTVPPLLDCPLDAVVECESAGQAWVALPPAVAQDECSSSVTISNDRTDGGSDASGSYLLGTTDVWFTATDPSGNVARCSTKVTVRDTVAPVIESVATPDLLWPPNHKMASVSVSLVVGDACDTTPRVELYEASSSESDDAKGGGDGHTTHDIQDAELGAADTNVSLRAERDGNGEGRVYTLRYRATDNSGNEGVAAADIEVPHNLADAVEPLVMRVDGAAETTLSWAAVNGATHYDVVRGELGNLRVDGSRIDLGTIRVLESGSTRTDTIGSPDSDLPPIGAAFFYLVQFHDGIAHSSFGTESAGREYHWEGPEIP